MDPFLACSILEGVRHFQRYLEHHSQMLRIKQETHKMLTHIVDKCGKVIWIVLDEAQVISTMYTSAFYTENNEKKIQKGHG